MEFTFQIEGLEELDRLLAELPDEVESRGVMRDALKEGAVIIRDAAKDKCPVYHGPARPDVTPGQLRDSIKVRTRTRKGNVTVLVQTGAGDFKGDEFYGAFVEFGHKVGKRPFRGRKQKFRDQDTRAVVEPHPYLRPAFDEKKAEAQVVIADAARAALAALLAKHNLDGGPLPDDGL